MKVYVGLALALLIAMLECHGQRIVDADGKLISSAGKDNRIVGGTLAEEGFAPYQVSLQDKTGFHQCAGAILDRKWIITAGHCVDKLTPSDRTVITGTIRWLTPGARYYIESIYMHCNYDKPYMHNDIALLKLNDSIVYDAYTGPIALPIKRMKENDEVILTGWGASVSQGAPTEYLHKLYVKYVLYEPCLAIFNNTANMGIGHICTYSQAGEGACHGDSGGPLISDGKLVGIVNWGRPCGVGLPDVQANVHYYTDWIRRIMSGTGKC